MRKEGEEKFAQKGEGQEQDERFEKGVNATLPRAFEKRRAFFGEQGKVANGVYDVAYAKPDHVSVRAAKGGEEKYAKEHRRRAEEVV